MVALSLKVRTLFCLAGFLVMMMLSTKALAAEDCGSLLTKSAQMPKSFAATDATHGLIVYLTALEDDHILGAEEIQNFSENLEQNILVNPITEKLAALSTTLKIHREGLETYFLAGGLDVSRLREWAKRSLSELKTEDVERDTVESKTDNAFKEIVFHPVVPKPFKMGTAKKERDRVLRELAQPFEMMSTPVTQYQWAQVMKANPARFTEGEAAISVTVEGAVLIVQPDHPVERVSWWSAVIFANHLSQLKGLKPAYILDESAISGDAALGTAMSATQLIRYNSSSGSVYDTEGYRLPTETEQEFVLRAAGRAQGKYFFGDDADRLEEHAWFNRNSDQSTQAVGQKPPIVINGFEFFDLLGNIEEWSNDWYSDTLLPGVNPLGPSMGKERVIRGGSWIADLRSLESTTRWFANPNHSSPLVGFRLVRTSK